MKSLTKIVSVLMAMILTFGAFGMFFTPVAEASTAGHTAQEGANWAKNNANKHAALDYDGNGPWCVDLIFCYYKYLGQASKGGNARDYRSNKLPAGWTRIIVNNSTQFKAGDIAVWAKGDGVHELGHVGIIVDPKNSASFTTVEQHANGKNYCDYFTRQRSALYCVIRPDFVVPVSDVNVSTVSKTVTGKDIAVKDFLTLTYNGKTLQYNVDYTVNKTTVKWIGRYDITITGKGAFTGTRKVKIDVIPVTPGGVTAKIYSILARVQLSWNKVGDCTGYQVQIAKNKNFNNAHTSKKDKDTTSISYHECTFGGKKETLKKGTYYYLRVRSYKNVTYGNVCITLYSPWSATKTVRW